MKKLIIVLSVCLALVATTSFAQVSPANTANSVEQKEALKNSHAPIMEFDKLVHDYGKIIENGDGGCVFTLTNTGKEPLILTDAHSSCGCTVPEWSKSPILPGQSTEIKVMYKTSRIGAINKTVTVSSNAANSPIVLRIKGEVLKKDATSQLEKNVEGGATPVAQ